ncbi:MAG: hypothetical protein HKN17_10180, partial [Rhodothermales bacterium]|nr:hypothetical protein [Rhodothermales bacterium]
GLGFPCEVFWHAKYLPEHYEKALTGVGGERVTTIMELPKDFSAVPELAAWERGTEKLGVFKFDADAAAEYLNHMIGKGKFLEVDPNAITEEMVRENHGWTFVQARTTHGELGYNLWGETDPSEEAKTVLLRFARVFDLAYRRYEDLRESEAAVREARIEAALERVRARTMGMHSSDELREVAMMYAAQLDELGMDIHGAMFLLQDPDDEAWTLWTGYSQNYPLEHVRGKTFEFPFQEVEGDPSLDAWRRGETVMESFVPPDELPAWSEKYRIVLDASDQTADDWIRFNPDGYFRIDAYMKYGVVAAGGPRSFTEEEVDIQVRFAREFERTYRRFLDLKKAEAQARESRIEAALERMRSRTMAMQASDELLDVSSVMTEQLVELGIDIHWAYLYLYNEEQDELEVYLTKSSTHPVPQARRGSGLWTYPRSFHDPGQGQDEFIAVWRKRDAFRTADWGKDRFDEWADQFQMMFDALGYSREDYRPHAPDGIFNVEALMGPGYVGMGGARPMDQDDIDVLVRFANEFEGTYRRFLDIKRAEAQARESQVEAALERVRGRAMAMQEPDDIGATCKALFDEVQTLCPDVLRLGIGVAVDDDKLQPWLVGADADGRPCIYEGRIISEGEREELDTIFAARREQQAHWFKETRDFLEWATSIYTHAVDEAVIPVDLATDQYFSAFPHQTGWIYVVSPDPYEADDEAGRIVS